MAVGVMIGLSVNMLRSASSERRYIMRMNY